MAPALLAFFAFFFLAAFLWPTWRLWRRERVNALVAPFDDSAEGMIARRLRAILPAVFALLAALSWGLPPTAVGPLAWLERPWLDAAGWAMLLVSLAWIVVAQFQMDASWRMGIDPRSNAPLVRSGLFALSRNPIFLAMRLGLIGLFLVLPNAVTLAIALLGDALMQVQVRLEEKHLGSAFGNAYDDYRQRVPRWL
jgi:protein-S-isoprenylcysteine O-methyltransferase Ste14